MMTKLGQVPLLYEPGSRWRLQRLDRCCWVQVVEVASGKPLDEFFAERIFKPLDMKDSGFPCPTTRSIASPPTTASTPRT